VDLYEKYKGRVGFVIIDLDRDRPPEQQILVKKYYQGSIPHILVLDSKSKAVYNAAGEVEQKYMEELLDSLLRKQ